MGSIVEIILLMVLLVQNQNDDKLISVIKDAILGSILANMLLCLGTCFVVGGIRYESQQFDGVISEVGSGLLLTAGFGLAIPCAFFSGRSLTCSTCRLADNQSSRWDTQFRGDSRSNGRAIDSQSLQSYGCHSPVCLCTLRLVPNAYAP